MTTLLGYQLLLYMFPCLEEAFVGAVDLPMHSTIAKERYHLNIIAPWEVAAVVLPQFGHTSALLYNPCF